jgi:hypothetical protein
MKNKKYKIPRLPKYPNGGNFGKDVGDVAMNLGRGYLDASLGVLGMNNVIQDDAYSGAGSQFAMQTADVAGQIGKTALPFALQAAGVPTQATQASQQVLGSFNPQSTTKLEDVNYNTKRIANAGSALAGPGLNMLRNGGRMFANGGINSEVELQENSITPDGEFTQYNGPSHENGGIKTNLEPGEMIFSDKLKLGKKTFADLNKVNNTNKEDKVLEDKKVNHIQKLTAQLMKDAKLKQSMSLFEQQESLKEDKLNRYAKRLGIDSKSFKNGGVQKYPGGGTYPGYNPNTSAHMLAAGQKPLDETELTGLGYTHPTNNNEQWWNANTGRFYKAYSPGQPGYIDPMKYMNQGAPVMGNTETRIFTNQIPSNNNTPNPIDGPARKPIEFGNMGAYNPNTGLLTESTGYNKPINTQTFSYRNGGVKKYDNGGFGTVDSPSDEEISMIGSNLYQPTTIVPGNDYSQLLGIGKQALIGLGSNVGNLYDLSRAQNTEVESYGRMNPTLLNNNATVDNNRRIYKNNLDALKGSVGGNSSSYIQSRIAMDNDRMANDAISQQNIDNANAGILNNAQGTNINLDIAEKTANSQNRAASRNIKGSAYSNIGQNIMGQSRDINATKMDQKTLDAIIASNPKWANSAEGKAYLAKYKK